MPLDERGGLRAAAARLLPCLDLTSLNDDDTPETIDALCRRAVTPFGRVAAVCIYPRFVKQAKAHLRDTNIRVAAVANFPQGNGRPEAVVGEVESSIGNGADEIDIVIDHVAYLAGAQAAAMQPVAVARRCCGERVRLKAILETGRLARPDIVLAAARDAIAAGADFLKTSTGKTTPGAEPEATEMLLTAIRDHWRAASRLIGLKAAGGIRMVPQARTYLHLAERLMGPDYPQPASFRIGASALLNDILDVLGDGEESRNGGDY